MQSLSPEVLADWRSTATVIERDGYGEKVLSLSDGSYLKIFRRKRLLTKNALWPPAKRFADNATSLSQRDVPCPNVLATYKMSNPSRTLVRYQPLEGNTLRHLIKATDAAPCQSLLEQLGDFVAMLHERGVYFRSLHPGNIIVTPTGKFGLIDISDMRCIKRPLPRSLRKRNLKHLFRYEADWETVRPELRETLRRRILKGPEKASTFR